MEKFWKPPDWIFWGQRNLRDALHVPSGVVAHHNKNIYRSRSWLIWIYHLCSCYLFFQGSCEGAQRFRTQPSCRWSVFLGKRGWFHADKQPPVSATATGVYEDVVQITASTIHWDFDFAFSQNRDPARACALATLIRIRDLKLAIFRNSPFQCLNAKVGIKRIWGPSSQNLADRPIHDFHQVQKATLNWVVGGVAAPNLIGQRGLSQQIGTDSSIWGTSCWCSAHYK